MKAFVVTLLIFAVCGMVMSDDIMEKRKATMKACREENKASEQEFEDLHSGKTKPEDASQAVKCTMKCVMEKTGVMDPATGEFLADRLKEKLVDKPNLADVIDKCKGQKGANPCETAFMISGCMNKNRVPLGV